ncbi:tail fiber domain-containing protein [Rhizobium sp. LC145]|uniref:tail fiber domain-containing protein n=1 Tax=Rhizobium sp. LC145 TaxID=1120688 RepID=UPI00069976D1|nr:tail fiber domain-containing protein [Rhizobium sp. LC145]TKT67070.1 tail fiber domain-containing protein [Rhizobiaceae bacterium LC148]
MALLSDYTSGTISVAADGTAVTGVDTGWVAAGFREGDLLFANGYTGVVRSVESNTALTLDQPWQGGALSGASYRLRYQSDGSRFSAQARALMDLLGGSGNLEAFGSLEGTADTLPYFTGAGQMDVTALTAFARTLLDDPDASALLSTLGVSAFAKTLLDDADEAAFRQGIGLDQVDNTSDADKPVSTATEAALAGKQDSLGFTPVNKAGDTMTGVLTGAASSEAFPPPAFVAPASTHAASRRAGIQVGSWALLQDLAGNGVLDVGFFSGLVNSSRLRITPSGAIALMGNASPAGWLDISSVANATRLYMSGYGANQGYGIVMRAGVDTAAPILFKNPANTDVGSINTSATGTAYSTASDYRLKSNVEPLVSFSLTDEQFDLLDDAVLRVMAMRPVSFTWSEYPETGLQTGFIAHELQQAAPHAVSGQKDAEEDIGTATIPEKVIPPQGDQSEQIIPAQVFENVCNGEIEGAEWVKMGTRPVYQAVDHGRLTPDLVAAVQSLTLMVLEQRAEMKAMAERISLLETA